MSNYVIQLSWYISTYVVFKEKYENLKGKIFWVVAMNLVIVVPIISFQRYFYATNSVMVK